MIRIRFISIICITCILSCGAASLKTNESNSLVERGNEIVDQALVPVYDMVRVFLEDIIQPNDLTYMQEKGVDFTDPDNVLDSFVENYVDWIWYLIGYVVLVGIGVILILVMCCAACCTCMCRTCCGKCGGKVEPFPAPEQGTSDPERCQRTCCSIWLLIVITLVLLGSLTMYFTAVRIHSELTTEDGLFYSVSDGLTMIDDYVDTTLQELEDETLGIYNQTVEGVFKELESVVNKSYTALDNEAGIAENIHPLLYFSSQMRFMSNALSNAQTNATDLQVQVNDVESNLTSVKSDIINVIASCADAACNTMVARVSNLSVTVDYSNIPGSFFPLIVAFEAADRGNLYDNLNAGYNNFTNIITQIDNEVMDEIRKAKDTAEELGEEIAYQIDEIKGDLDSISLNGTAQDIKDTGESIKEPSDYALYGTAGIAGLILLIVLFGYLGLLFGCCCPTPKPGSDGGCCSRKIGATCLLAGVGFTFIFFLFLMIFLMVLMISGGVLHTELCRHLVSIDQSPVMDIIDELMNETLFEDTGFFVNISDIYVNCKDDKAFYTALRVEETFGFDLDTILDVSGIKDEIDKIRNQSVTFGPINILSSEALVLLANLSGTVDNTKGNVDDAKTELGKDVTSEDLAQLADDLEELDQSQGTIPGLDLSIVALRSIITDVDDINAQKIITEGELTQVNDILDKTNLTARVIGLEKGNETVNDRGEDIINSFIRNTTYNVEDLIDKAVSSINSSVRSDVGQCAPVYNAYSVVVDSGCVEILYPLNAYWFALGWSVFFLIVGLIMSLKLATMYRRTYKKKNAVHPLGSDGRPLMGHDRSKVTASHK